MPHLRKTVRGSEVERRSDKLYHALCDKGVHEDLAREITRRMNTDYTSTRMIGYLYGHNNLREEDIVDEMLAILSDRNSLIQKHEMEEAQAKINRIYRNGL